jgi:hypothetical protein
VTPPLARRWLVTSPNSKGYDVVCPAALRTVPVKTDDNIWRQQARHANDFPNGEMTVPIDDSVRTKDPCHFMRPGHTIDDNRIPG